MLLGGAFRSDQSTASTRGRTPWGSERGIIFVCTILRGQSHVRSRRFRFQKGGNALPPPNTSLVVRPKPHQKRVRVRKDLVSTFFLTCHETPKTLNYHEELEGYIGTSHLRLQTAHDIHVLRGELERTGLESEVAAGRHAQDKAEVDMDQAALRVQKDLPGQRQRHRSRSRGGQPNQKRTARQN